VGALLHDIGKIGVPDKILAKEESLSGEEYEVIKGHPVIGSDIVRGLPFPDEVKMIIKHHHERFDGTGYPDGLKGEEIPLLVRIFSIMDVYEALVGFRPYRNPLSAESAADLLQECSGTQFDPDLLDLFFRCIAPSAED
jgi:putative nucleotidyltransferase with HDIG domain